MRMLTIKCLLFSQTDLIFIDLHLHIYGYLLKLLLYITVIVIKYLRILKCILPGQ